MKERAALLLSSETMKECGVYQFHGMIRAYFVSVGMEKKL